MLRDSFVVGMLVVMLLVMHGSAQAQLTPVHRKELAELNKQIGQAAVAIRKKDYDAAGAQLTEIEEKLKSIATDAGLEETDPTIKRVSVLIERQRTALEKVTGTSGTSGKGMPGRGSGDGVSFVKDVAPIINQRCLGCHGETNPRRNLRLDTFAGWQAGGRGGVLLIPGNPDASLLIGRLNAPQGQGRMPAQGVPLTDEEKEKISNWIKAGAPFDGANVTLPLATLIYEDSKKDVKIPKPTGNETVSFTRDIAPWMSTLCLNCHNARNRSGGLSVETFFDIMKGGESGEVIIPGDEGSRFFRLVGGLELPRMPSGDGRLTRKNYEDMKQWFKEGNTYDGNDPLTPIRSFVPSDIEIARQKFGSKSEAEMRQHRLSQTDAQFREVTGMAPREKVESPEFVVVGDVDRNRLQTVSTWAQKHLGEIQKSLGGSGTPWRGGLTIFVWKERDQWERFISRVEARQPPREVFGAALVTLGHEEAYVVLQDTGDAPDRGPGLQETLVQQMTVAYLQKGDYRIPNWIALGIGYVQSEPLAGASRTKLWKDEAAALAPTVNQPRDLFVDGTFSSAATGSVGYSFVRFAETQGGKDRFTRFLQALQKGDAFNEAFKATYGVDAEVVAGEYFKNLKSR